VVAPTTHSGWFVDNDLIRSLQNAWWQGRNAGLTHLYSGDGAILEGPPGYQLWLVAAVLLGQHVGLSPPVERASSSVSAVGAAVHPVGGIWYLVVPLALVVAFAAVFPIDSLIRRAGLAGRRRVLTLSGVTVLIGWSAAYWGHPEYPVAVGFLAWALVRADERRWCSAGWLLGLGLACQPMVLLTLPLLVILARADWWRVLIRVCIPPLVTTALPIIGDPSDTVRAILRAPGDPRFGHHTPLLAVVPHPHLLEVNSGWPRTASLLVAVALAVPLAGWVRDRLDLRALIWATAALLSLRGCAEALFYPYYLTPFLIMSLCLVVGHRWPRAFAGMAWAAALTAFASAHVLGPWAYWSVLLVGEAGLLVLAYPPAHGRSQPTDAGASSASVRPEDPGQLASAPTT